MRRFASVLAWNRLTVIVSLAAISSFGLGQQKAIGPPGFHPNQNPTVAQKRGEPAWSHSTLEQKRTDLSRVRAEVEGRTGVLPGDAFIDLSLPEAAYTGYQKSKRSADAFRAIYLYMATGREVGNGDKYEALFSVLPKDEYEVARLHFMWSAPDAVNSLAPLGDRLLGKDPKDTEVLYVMAMLRSTVAPDRDLVRAKGYAEAALKAKPCASTYLRYGMVMMYVAMESKSAKAGKASHQYIDRYLAARNPKDSYRKALADVWLAWLKKNGY